MATLALIAVALLALLVFALFGGLVELFRDVRQLRDAAGILDRSLPIDIDRAEGASPSEFGLPPGLDHEPAALVLFLSDGCATCRVLAKSFGPELPHGLWVVLQAHSHERAIEFADGTGLTSVLESGKVVIDAGGGIAQRLGLRTTPAGFHVEHGSFTRAGTVPSTRYLSSVLPQQMRLRGPDSARDRRLA